MAIARRPFAMSKDRIATSRLFGQVPRDRKPLSSSASRQALGPHLQGHDVSRASASHRPMRASHQDAHVHPLFQRHQSAPW